MYLEIRGLYLSINPRLYSVHRTPRPMHLGSFGIALERQTLSKVLRLNGRQGQHVGSQREQGKGRGPIVFVKTRVSRLHNGGPHNTALTH